MNAPLLPLGPLTRPIADMAFTGIHAAGQALFPDNGLGAPTWSDVAGLERTIAWINSLPPKQRGLILSLFTFAELGGPTVGALLGRGRPARLSALSPDARRALIRQWRSSPIRLLRFAGDALKATLGMIYLSHPSALAHIGAYKATDSPADSLLVTREAALAGPNGGSAGANGSTHPGGSQ